MQGVLNHTQRQGLDWFTYLSDSIHYISTVRERLLVSPDVTWLR